MSAAGRKRDAESSLGDELQAVERWLSEDGLRVVPAWIQERAETTTLHWGAMPSSDSPDWRGFLAEAKALRAPFVALMAQRLTMEDWEEANALASEVAAEHGAPPGETDWLVECRTHIGEVGAFELKWLAPDYPGVLFAFRRFAPWFDTFLGRDDRVAHGQAKSIGRALSEADVQKYAVTVARSAEYERATDYRQQDEVAR